MQVLPAGTTTDREYHRLQPITSDPESRTEAERLESLRRAACEVGADAVIEAVNEEIRTSEAVYATVSSGTAVVWVRRPTGETKPFATYSGHAAKPDATEAVEPEAPPPAEAPPAAPTATPAASGTAKTPAPPATTTAATPTAKPATSAAPASSGPKLLPKKK